MNYLKNITDEIIDEFGKELKVIYDILDKYNATPVCFINENHHYVFNIIIKDNTTLYYRRLYINLNTLKNHTTLFPEGTMYG